MKKKFTWLNIHFAITNEKSIIAGPIISAPHLALVIEYLIPKGLKKVLSLGWCGKNPNSSIELGALFIPTKAYSLEGTSKFYFKQKKIFSIDKFFLGQIEEFLSKFGISFYEGSILSVDVPFQVEKRQKEFNFYLDKVLAMDMETSALYALSKYYGLKAGALLFVTDEIGKETIKRPESKMQSLRLKLFTFFKSFLEHGFEEL